jgi:hypothetical protein
MRCRYSHHQHNYDRKEVRRKMRPKMNEINENWRKGEECPFQIIRKAFLDTGYK